MRANAQQPRGPQAPPAPPAESSTAQTQFAQQGANCRTRAHARPRSAAANPARTRNCVHKPATVLYAPAGRAPAMASSSTAISTSFAITLLNSSHESIFPSDEFGHEPPRRFASNAGAAAGEGRREVFRMGGAVYLWKVIFSAHTRPPGLEPRRLRALVVSATAYTSSICCLLSPRLRSRRLLTPPVGR